MKVQTVLIKRLIRIYTPFICALTAVIHGVLFLLGYNGIILWILGKLTGHSILLILYILSTSDRMCIWYKTTNYLLLSIHFAYIIYKFGYIESGYIIYISLKINILALICFLIYRVTKGITKILC